MSERLPQIKGNELIKLLEKDGWEIARKGGKHFSLVKKFKDRTRVTTIKNTSNDIPRGTLNAILGKDQTNLGREGFLKLLHKK